MQCKNCNTQFIGNFCPECGQSARIDRIYSSYLIRELFHFFTHVEKQFLQTSWLMLTSPGPLFLSFVNGKRKSYQSPVSYFLIWATSTIVCLYGLEIFFGKDQVIQYNNYYGEGQSTDFAVRHLSFVLAFLMPVFSIYFWLLCARPFYNYFESLTCVLYVLGTILMLQTGFILIALCYYCISSSSLLLIYSDPQKVLYLIWFSYSFLRTSPHKNKWIRGILFVALAFISFSLWRIKFYPWLAMQFLIEHL